MPEPSDRSSPIAATFRRLASQGRRAFIPYITAGYPAPERTPDILRLLAEEGADLIELGVPFSDPLADGPIIQRAAWQALRAGVGLPDVLRWAESFAARSDVPIVLFTYLNPILRYGAERFVADARACGAAGLLVTDLPVGEDEPLERTLSAGGLDLVRLVAPTTPRARIERIVRAARGFIYYISRTGVTGERKEVRRGLEDEVRQLRELTDLPIAVGFGISTGEQARTVAAVTNGVVVGSALVRSLSEGGAAALHALRELSRELRAGIDAGSA